MFRNSQLHVAYQYVGHVLWICQKCSEYSVVYISGTSLRTVD